MKSTYEKIKYCIDESCHFAMYKSPWYLSGGIDQLMIKIYSSNYSYELYDIPAYKLTVKSIKLLEHVLKKSELAQLIKYNIDMCGLPDEDKLWMASIIFGANDEL